MAFDEILAARIRHNLARKEGNMLVGVWKESLIVRLGGEQAEAALLEPHVKPFDITGKPMKRWAMVAPDSLQDDEQLKDWIQRAVKFVGKLPPK
jgi:hypothetical protein